MAREVSSFVGALYSHTLSSLTPLGLTGLLALADLDIVAQRTALSGTPTWSDALIICPGLHRQQKAGTLSNGEFPACAAMTTGYVFRVENPATVFYLQSVSETGKLTNIYVSKAHPGHASYVNIGHLAVASSVLAVALLASVQDWLAVSYLLVLALVLLVNTATIRSRAAIGWHGQEEPDQLGDLFILLSYDRWVRMRGQVDDLKAVTSGRWLQRPTTLQDVMSACATLLAYAAPILAANATHHGQIVITLLLLVNTVVLSIANRLTDFLHMKDRVVRIVGERKVYERRSLLASELVSESGRLDWAVSMGLIVGESQYQSPVVM
jgi:hypothetical protein